MDDSNEYLLRRFEVALFDLWQTEGFEDCFSEAELENRSDTVDFLRAALLTALKKK
jgi:hypothetical protein